MELVSRILVDFQTKDVYNLRLAPGGGGGCRCLIPRLNITKFLEKPIAPDMEMKFVFALHIPRALGTVAEWRGIRFLSSVSESVPGAPEQKEDWGYGKGS